MHFSEILLHAIKDTLVILPILLLVYLLIELLEYKKILHPENSKFLKGKFSPIFGSIFGCIPQCGFSVISAELYSKKALSIGALVAVFISTSDEAIPMLLANPDSYLDLVLLVLAKIVLGVLIGYLAEFFCKLLFKSKPVVNENVNIEHLEGCCNHSLENQKFDFFHPIFHSLKICLFIFIINFIMTFILHLVGEQNLTNFLQQSHAFQPILACIIGLIPNCVGSVIITELFILGNLSFGSVIAGLCVNSGIAFLVLLKHNKDWKENLFVLLVTLIPSLAVGYLLHFIV